MDRWVVDARPVGGEVTARLTFTINGFEPDWAVHPGETLEELLALRGWSQAEFARTAGLTAKHVNQIIKGKAGIGPNAALALEAATHVSAEFWARLQAQYDVAVARKAHG